MVLWNREYASQTGGSMDFWDKLTPSQKDICREVVVAIEHAASEAEVML
jgi:hypothetical protein